MSDRNNDRKEPDNIKLPPFNRRHFDKLMQRPDEEKKKITELKNGRRINEWQYKLLKVCATDDEGIKAWNVWRNKNLGEEILLEGANLREAYLEGANLEKAYLKGANLSFAHLEDAKLWHAHLEDAKLRVAHLENAKLLFAHLESANLDEACLEGAKFEIAQLEGADFNGAYVNSETTFFGCHIDKNTDFRNVSLNTIRIQQGTKQLLEYNIRRMNWQDWYPKHPFLRGFVWWFWSLSDYGRSTGRIIGWFLGLALAFAVVYSNLAWIYPPGILDGLFTEPNSNEQMSLVSYFLVVLLRPIYFSVVTMTTLGFGDMYARAWSWPGHLLLMLQVLLGYVLLAALVTRFAVLFTAGGPAGRFSGEKTLRQKLFGDRTFTEWFFGEQPKKPKEGKE